MEKCAAIGPRGGKCTTNAQRVDGLNLLYQADFCPRHNQMVRDGQVIWCAKCDGPAIPPPTS
jgi:hypothetical protein